MASEMPETGCRSPMHPKSRSPGSVTSSEFLIVCFPFPVTDVEGSERTGETRSHPLVTNLRNQGNLGTATASRNAWTRSKGDLPGPDCRKRVRRRPFAASTNSVSVPRRTFGAVRAGSAARSVSREGLQGAGDPPPRRALEHPPRSGIHVRGGHPRETLDVDDQDAEHGEPAQHVDRDDAFGSGYGGIRYGRGGLGGSGVAENQWTTRNPIPRRPWTHAGSGKDTRKRGRSAFGPFDSSSRASARRAAR